MLPSFGANNNNNRRSRSQTTHNRINKRISNDNKNLQTMLPERFIQFRNTGSARSLHGDPTINANIPAQPNAQKAKSYSNQHAFMRSKSPPVPSQPHYNGFNMKQFQQISKSEKNIRQFPPPPPKIGVNSNHKQHKSQHYPNNHTNNKKPTHKQHHSRGVSSSFSHVLPPKYNNNNKQYPLMKLDKIQVKNTRSKSVGRPIGGRHSRNNSSRPKPRPPKGHGSVRSFKGNNSPRMVPRPPPGSSPRASRSRTRNIPDSPGPGTPQSIGSNDGNRKPPPESPRSKSKSRSFKPPAPPRVKSNGSTTYQSKGVLFVCVCFFMF